MSKQVGIWTNMNIFWWVLADKIWIAIRFHLFNKILTNVCLSKICGNSVLLYYVANIYIILNSHWLLDNSFFWTSWLLQQCILTWKKGVNDTGIFSWNLIYVARHKYPDWGPKFFSFWAKEGVFWRVDECQWPMVRTHTTLALT